jgi:hypothetical protein
MPQPKRTAHLLALARRGAEVRAHELVSELKNLVALFPHVQDTFDADELPLSFIIAKGSGQARRVPAGRPRARGRRRVSAAARKATSERMRRYWAERRKAKKAGQK